MAIIRTKRYVDTAKASKLADYIAWALMSVFGCAWAWVFVRITIDIFKRSNS